MISHLNKVTAYDVEKIDVPDVSYIESENSLKYAQIKEKCTVTLSVSSVGIGTFCAPFDIELPENVTALYITAIKENGAVDLEEYNLTNRILPAYSPAVIKSNDVVSKSYEGYKTSTQVVCSHGLTGGTVETVNVSEVFKNKKVYVLQNQSYGVGFYLCPDNYSLAAYKAVAIESK